MSETGADDDCTPPQSSSRTRRRTGETAQQRQQRLDELERQLRLKAEEQQRQQVVINQQLLTIQQQQEQLRRQQTLLDQKQAELDREQQLRQQEQQQRQDQYASYRPTANSAQVSIKEQLYAIKQFVMVSPVLPANARLRDRLAQTFLERINSYSSLANRQRQLVLIVVDLMSRKCNELVDAYKTYAGHDAELHPILTTNM